MFVRSRWYVAALSHEVTRLAPLGRTFLDEKVVLFRTLDSTVVALADRCPHRFAPLSIGRTTNDGIQCAYHGMTFDRRGICALNPTQPGESIPPYARVRSYPVVERHGAVWIWMGEAAQADPLLIPNFFQFDDPQWTATTDYTYVKCNYLLLVDNLLDLTHINFVHGDIFGSPADVARMTSRTETTERGGVIEHWMTVDSPPAPVWVAMVNEPWMQGNVDYWNDMEWEAPANLILRSGITPPGKPRGDGFEVVCLDCLTPETSTTTHYFWGQTYLNRPHSKSLSSLLNKAGAYAFGQDVRLLEAVQANMGEQWDILAMNPVINKGDRGALRARRVLRDLIEAETGRGSTAGERRAG